MRRRWIFLVLLCATSSPAAEPDTQVQAHASTTRLGAGQTLELTVQATIGGSGGRREYLAPDLTDFDVLQFSPQQATEWMIDPLHGQRVHRVEKYVYVLRPKRKGTLRIGAAKVIVGNKTFSTQPIEVRVTDADVSLAAPPSAPPPSPHGDDEVFLDVKAEPPKVFLGQQVTVSWYLYTRSEVLKYRTVTEPKSDGFWVEEIYTPVQRLLYERAPARGRDYSVATLLRRALFPLQAGTLTIGPMESEITTFSSAFYGSSGAIERTAPLRIEVMPLPSGAPAGFEPANVGQFTVDATLDRAQVAAGEPATLKVTVTGQGNLRNLRLKPRPPGKGYKIYEPKVIDQIEPGDKIQGTKIVEYLIVAEQAGELSIAPAELVYFDPEAKKYVTAGSPALSLKVVGTVAQAGTRTGAPAENVLAPAIRNLRNTKKLDSRVVPTLYRSRLFGPLLGIPALLYLLLIVGSRIRARLRRETPRARLRRARGRARRRFRAAEYHLKMNRPAPFYGEIARVVNEHLEERLGVPVVGKTLAELETLLEERGFPRPTVARIVAELEGCDFARFAATAAGPSEMRGALRRARELLRDIERAPVREVAA